MAQWLRFCSNAGQFWSPRANLRGKVRAGGQAMDEESARERLRRLESENAALRAELANLHAAPSSQDISQREALLVQAERVAHVGSWAWDLRSGAIQWSDELYRILGRDPALEAPSAQGFFNAVHADDRARVEHGSERGLTASDPEPVEFRIVRADGSVRHVRMEGAPFFGQDGTKTHVVGVVIDLTESIQASARMADALEDLRIAQAIARVGSYSLDLPRMKTTWSQGMFDVLGVSGAELPSPDAFFDCVHPDDRERAKQGFQHMLATDAGLKLELRMLKPDGQIWYAIADSAPQYDDEGKLIGFNGIIQDVTQQKEEAERLRHSEKMAAIGTLAGGIAHDFNNYLAVLMGETELLRGLLDAGHRAQRGLSAILTVASRCARLTSQLLTLGRKRALQVERFELGGLVTAMTPMLRAILGERNELLVHLPPSSVFVRADPTELEHALVNLAVNARDALTRGGCFTLAVEHVRADPFNESAPGSFVRISATDDGEGIAPEVLPRIFEPFFTTKGVGGGSGLGLSTVHSVIEQAGGSIEVLTEVGRGTTFRISLPLDTSDADSPDATESSAEPTKLTPGRCVLVVEDVTALRNVIREQLLAAGYTVLTAENGRAALQVLERNRGKVDMVLSDVVMPVLGGFELERILNEHYPHIRCLLMTGYAEGGSEDRQRGVALRKPFTRQELLCALGACWTHKPASSRDAELRASARPGVRR
jgi:PAS domain S-box-containing protein